MIIVFFCKPFSECCKCHFRDFNFKNYRGAGGVSKFLLIPWVFLPNIYNAVSLQCGRNALVLQQTFDLILRAQTLSELRAEYAVEVTFILQVKCNSLSNNNTL